ncbi:hypothetical protein DFJ73DRAFT_780807 [Zopfochytrium polystomum]|nr:hypothetical protein DFJ73DRAFT_780807 [Zopfochytrium polystomum]
MLVSRIALIVFRNYVNYAIYGPTHLTSTSSIPMNDCQDNDSTRISSPPENAISVLNESCPPSLTLLYDPILVIKTNQNWVALYGEPAADAVIDAIATYKRRRTQARRDVDAPGIMLALADRAALKVVPFTTTTVPTLLLQNAVPNADDDCTTGPLQSPLTHVEAASAPFTATERMNARKLLGDEHVSCCTFVVRVRRWCATTATTVFIFAQRTAAKQSADNPTMKSNCAVVLILCLLLVHAASAEFFLLWRCLRTVHVVTEVGDQQFSTNSWRFAYSGRKNGDDLTVQDSWSKFHSDTYEDVFLSRDDMMGPIKDDTRYGRLTLGDFGDCSRTNADRECIGALYKDGQAWARCFNNYHGWTSTYFEPIGIQFVDNVCSLEVTCFVPPEPLNWDNA